jgi:LmbE family N-acetylglucosaminyl deacetylase
MQRPRRNLLLAILALLLASLPAYGQNRAEVKKPASILVFAPHPDDESLGCAGVILRGVRLGLRVRVAFLTNGDGYPRAAATLREKEVKDLDAEDFLALGRARQQQARQAAAALGLGADGLIFLAYPDAGLSVLTDKPGDSYRSKFTGKSSTYALEFPDYHSQAHGKPAPYVRSAALGDVRELIEALRPGQIYVTSGVDKHPDHKATFALVREAAVAAAFQGEFYTYLIHSGPGAHQWPWPARADPNAKFEAHVVDGQSIPSGLPWPPDERRPLSPAEAALKLKAIREYTLEIQLQRDYVESFVKAEEIFWREKLPTRTD